VKNIFGSTPVPVWHKTIARYHGISGHRDLQPLPRSARHGARRPLTLRFRIAEAMSNPDFIATAIFCAIGFLATVNFILRIPELGMP
jgi:hypothetical protein